MAHLSAASLLLFAVTTHGNPNKYSTDFRDESSVLSQWTLAKDCEHCTKSGEGNRKQCTQMTPNATTFGEKGMIHTTTKSDPTQSSCGAYANSGHATWKPALLYGNFTVTAKWFPGPSSVVSTATGYIGLDSSANDASITMGFHGEGWPMDNAGSHRYQTGIYADNSKGTSHNGEVLATDVSIADSLCTYGLLWSPSRVEWSFNGKVVRTFTNASRIPSIKMKLRLHSRSGYADKMPSNASFTAQFTKFEYQPLPAEMLV